MAKSALKESSPAVLFRLAFPIIADFHHFDPNPQQVKAMLDAPYLIMGPRSHGPWTDKIIASRKGKKTLLLPSFPIPKDKKFNQRTWDHFWLNPYTYCQSYNYLAKKLIDWLAVKTNPCPFSNDFFNQPRELSFDTNLYIISHDSLGPLLTALNKKWMALKGSHHGEEISSKTLKSIYKKSSQKTNLVWLWEKHLPIPEFMPKLISKSQHKKIMLTTLRSFPSPEQNLLKSLIKKISSIKHQTDLSYE